MKISLAFIYKNGQLLKQLFEKILTWGFIEPKLPEDYQPVHLLWSKLFLKCYSTEHVNHAIANCDEKTFRKRVYVTEHLTFIKFVRILFI